MQKKEKIHKSLKRFHKISSTKYLRVQVIIRGIMNYITNLLLLKREDFILLLEIKKV